MATKIVYHTPLDADGKRARHDDGPHKGKEKPVERHELPIIDAHDAVRRFPSQWSFAKPEDVDDDKIVDRRLGPTIIEEDESLAPNGDPGDPAVRTAPRIDPVDRPPLGGGPSQREADQKPDRRKAADRDLG